ncbi:hypothetical protein GCM10009574_092030 [Streptomyces asiaticus]|uniref:Transposase IS4-like domain-containing protein n=2 Tax=Streptomyces rhizosphaericus TaxID=114699 RepID=A0ABN1RA76_9ACTN
MLRSWDTHRSRATRLADSGQTSWRLGEVLDPVDRSRASWVPPGGARSLLSYEIHIAADARCRPLAFVLTAGQAGDAPAFTDVMARLRVPRRRGRPRTRPDMVLADRAYSSARSATTYADAVSAR